MAPMAPMARIEAGAFFVVLFVGIGLLLGGWPPSTPAKEEVNYGGGLMTISSHGERLLQQYRELQAEEDARSVKRDTLLVMVVSP